MNEPIVYEIRTLDDFTKVPPDRIPDCLKEFQMMIEIWRGLQAIADTLDGVNLRSEAFKWRDDGEPGIRNLDITVVAAESPDRTPDTSKENQ